MTVAIAFEDPSKDDDRKANDRLWQVARGLQAAFTSGRDADKNKKRDVTLADFKARFDNTSNETAPKQARWGIPGGKVVVTTTTYVHQDYLAMIPMELTPQILEDYFTGTDAPTLLFAREERYRSVGLENKDNINFEGSTLTVKLGPAKCPEKTLLPSPILLSLLLVMLAPPPR